MGYPLPAPVVEHEMRIDSEGPRGGTLKQGAACETSVTSDDGHKLGRLNVDQRANTS